MKLEFSGAPEVRAARPRVWARLLDPNFLAASAPGVESVETVDPTHFTVTSGLGMGSVRVQVKLDVALSNIVENERLTVSARGKAAGSALDVVSAVRLEDTPAGGTRLNWSSTSDVNGPAANAGGLVQAAARRLTEGFWTDFARRVGNG